MATLDRNKAEQGTMRLGYIHARFVEAIRKSDNKEFTYVEFINDVLNSNFIPGLELRDEDWIHLFCLVLGTTEHALYDLLAEEVEPVLSIETEFGEKFSAFWKVMKAHFRNTE